MAKRAFVGLLLAFVFLTSSNVFGSTSELSLHGGTPEISAIRAPTLPLLYGASLRFGGAENIVGETFSNRPRRDGRKWSGRRCAQRVGGLVHGDFVFGILVVYQRDDGFRAS